MCIRDSLQAGAALDLVLVPGRVIEAAEHPGSDVQALDPVRGQLLPHFLPVFEFSDARVVGLKYVLPKLPTRSTFFGVRFGENSGRSSKTNWPFLFLVGTGAVSLKSIGISLLLGVLFSLSELFLELSLDFTAGKSSFCHFLIRDLADLLILSLLVAFRNLSKVKLILEFRVRSCILSNHERHLGQEQGIRNRYFYWTRR